MAIKSKTKSEREYMSKAAALGCAVCRRLEYGETPAMLHHPRTGMGAGMRGKHSDVIPLCIEHHQGATGIHSLGLNGFQAKYGFSEMDLVHETKQLIGV